LRNLFSLCDRKKCFVKDIGDLSIEEMNYWIGFYAVVKEEIDEEMDKVKR
jgi:hypothetical protein